MEGIRMRAVKCPVCDGAGQLYTPAPTFSSSTSMIPSACHGCAGKGWVTVPAGGE